MKRRRSRGQHFPLDLFGRCDERSHQCTVSMYQTTSKISFLQLHYFLFSWSLCTSLAQKKSDVYSLKAQIFEYFPNPLEWTGGRSKLMTWSTPQMSRPRSATAVAMSTGVIPLRKSFSADSRWHFQISKITKITDSAASRGWENNNKTWSLIGLWKKCAKEITKPVITFLGEKKDLYFVFNRE